MNKLLTCISIAIIVSTAAVAQVPTYSNQSGGIANAFPLNNTTTSRKVQWYIPASSLGTLTALHNITHVYFQAGSSATQVYPIINIKLKSGFGMTSLSGTSMEPGMMLVFTAINYTLSTVAGNWFVFPLQTQFTYDPTQPLVVEMEHNATGGTGPTVYQTAITATGATRQYADYNTNSPLTGSDATRRINFGIDAVPACQISISSSASGTNNAAICSGSSLTLTTNAVSNYSWSTGSTASSIVVSPAATTVYSLTATSVSACTGTKAYTVTVNASAPVLTVSSSASTLCTGKSASLTASGAITYTWSHGVANGGSFVPTSTASYTVTGQNGCGTSSAVTSISVGPIPVQIASSSPSVCAGSSALFSVTAVANSFTWTPQNTVTQSSVIGVAPQSSTGYTVTAGDGTCTGSASIHLIAQPVPTVVLAGSESTVCSGSPVTLTVSGADSYTWSPSSLSGTLVTHTPASSTLYQVSGSNSVGCTAAAVHLVLVDHPPSLTTNLSSATVCAGSTVNLSVQGATSYTWDTGANTSAITIAPLSNTVITVSGGHTSNTCVATKSFSVDAVTVALAVSASTAVCQGASATLSVQTSTAISWLPSGGASQFPVVQPNVTTVYSVSAKVATLNLSCSASNTVMVTVHPNPTVTASPARTLMCRNETNVITPQGASSYSLAGQVTSSSVTYTGTQTGVVTLTVAGVDANGCMGSGSTKVQVNVCNGLSEYGGRSIRIYPVPAADVLFIESDQPIELFIINVTGQVCKTVDLGADNSYRVEVRSLAAGVYFVRDSGGTVIEKIVVE